LRHNAIASIETQQEGRPYLGGLLVCDIPRGYRSRPVEAVPDWLTAAEISSDPLFSPGQQGGPSSRAWLSAFSAAVAENMLLASSANCVTATGTTPEAQPKQWPLPADRVPLPEPQYLGAEGDQIYLTDHSFFWAWHS
jgi:hypothetical protein